LLTPVKLNKSGIAANPNVNPTIGLTAMTGTLIDNAYRTSSFTEREAHRVTY
jgi:hypothetical protein